MENYSYFYQAVTKITEDRVKELIKHAKDAEARETAFPDAGSYYRACAQTIYLAWLDVTDGWQIEGDVERLETIIGSQKWVSVS
jgi:hypothetical protein